MSEIIVYGTDPCPRSTDDEIVVCARKPESERFRIPEALRQGGSLQSRQAWAARAKQFETVGATGINSCSPVGPGGWTGCTEQVINQAFTERRGRREGRQRPTQVSLKFEPFRRDPRVDLRFQRVERHRALSDHRIVETAQVEFAAELLLRLGAQLADLQFAQLVGQRLAGIGDVTIDLGVDIGVGQAVLSFMNATAWALLQPLAWMPVSTTSRVARHIS